MTSSPVATLLYKGPSFAHLIGSGADVSIIKHSVVKAVNGVIRPNESVRAFSGFGTQIVYTIGVCDLIIINVLPTLTLSVVPREVDVINDGML